MATLPTSAYVVLGLLDEHEAEEATPYQLDQWIRRGIGHFWAFPRSQLYAEAERLVRRGLIVEHQEEGGRRRRTLAITEAGRRELHRWLETPTQAATEIRDEGALRLYFQPLGRESSSPRDNAAAAGVIGRLAEEQIAAHQDRLAKYRQVVASGALRPGSPQRAALEIGLRFEQMIIEFWREVGESPADLLSPPPDGGHRGKRSRG